MAQVKSHLGSIHPALVTVRKQEQHITTVTVEMWNGQVPCMGKPAIQRLCSGKD